MAIRADLTFSGTGTGLGSGWTPCTFLSNTNGWNRASGIAVPNTYADDCGEAYTADSGIPADCWVTLTYKSPGNTTAGSGMGAYLRLASASSEVGYSFMLDLDGYTIARLNGGYTSLQAGGLGPIADDDQYCLEAVGTGATVTLNIYFGASPAGTLVATVDDTAGNRVTSAGIICVAGYSTIPAGMGISRVIIGDNTTAADFMPGTGGPSLPNLDARQ